MSSWVQYAIQLCKRGTTNADSDEKPIGGIILGILLSNIYIGVASNFYVHLIGLDMAVGGNCSLNYSTDELDPKLKHFCENVLSWTMCAIVGIVLPGVLYLFLGCVTLCVVERTESTRRLTCQHLWITYDFLTKLAAVAIFCILLNSDAHEFVIGTIDFKTAAIIYLIVVGIEAMIWLLTLGILLTFGVCSYCYFHYCGKD